MKLFNSTHSLLLLSSFLGLSNAEKSHLNDDSPCVARSPVSGLYFDLSPISLSPPQLKNGKKVSPEDRDQSWHSKGHDYPANFTINICAPVIEEVKDVVGVDSSRWQNVSAYYEREGKIYSIGEQASDPFFRGRKLVLNYTGGSPCPESNSTRRKSTIMSFLCDRDATATGVISSFVGTMDSCTYFFEVRSSAACGGIAVDPHSGGLGPAGVFGIIMFIAVVAYLGGGCAYQRTVMHQRGWRQCPNFSLWAGIFDFFKDMGVILYTSVTNCLPSKHTRSGSGYIRTDTNDRGGFIGAIGGRGARGARGSGGRGDVDAENRLIDQLDEEWED